MAFPFSAAPSPKGASPKPPSATPRDWRCRSCGRLLGKRRAGGLHIHLHGHDCKVSLPVESTCRCCGTHNRI